MPESNNTPLRHCPACRKFSRGANRCPYCGEKLQGGPISPWASFLRKPNLATHTLVAVCAVIFCLQLAVEFQMPKDTSAPVPDMHLKVMGVSGKTALAMGSNYYPFTVVHGQVWRLVTACFLHFDLIHILFNCMALHILGRWAETLWGRSRFWVVYFICGVAGSVTSTLWHPLVLHEAANSAGASGAVFGVLGMLFGLTLRYRGGIEPRVRDLVRHWVIYGIIFGVVVGADNAAHIGGLLMGMAFGYLLPPQQYRAQSRLADTLWAGGAILALIATTASFAFAGHFFFTITA